MKYTEILNKILDIKKTIINLQENIDDNNIYNYLEEATDELRHCEEYLDDKVFQEWINDTII